MTCVRQPIPPEGHDEEAGALFELRFRQTGVPAKINHGLGTRANPLDVTCQVERFRHERVVRYRGMIAPQTIQSQRVRQSARVPDLQAVGEETHLDGGIAVVITVGNGIDNRLSYRVGGKFIGGWGSNAGGASADGAVDFAQHEIKGLIGLAEEVAAIDLQGGEGTTVLGAVTMDTFGLGGAVELLRIGSEKEHGGIELVFPVRAD